jgi:mRNA interferase MazF
MVTKTDVPVRGGIYMMNFDPTMGHEQRGFRPAIVISENSYNKKTGLVLVCAITSARKGYPFEVYFEANTMSGVILTDQVRSVDWKARKLRYVENLPTAALTEAQAKLLSLIL